MVNKRQGRPRGGSDARERIVSAAQKNFILSGYTGATLRTIAQEAGVDHALVNYYFGTKENLFSEAMLGGFSPSAVFKTVRSAEGVSLATLPAMLARAFVAFCETPQIQHTVLPTLRLAFEDEDTRALVTGYIEREIFAEAEQLLLDLKERQNRPTKASAHEAVIGISTVLLGALVSRYLLRAGPHAAMSVREFGVLLERLLRGALG
ncbi:MULTISPECIES: TetR/AcrR family transcriptional regulator [Corynebacterium]|uniref:Putative regulatory protein n=1 Tax=Corynebacterium imitans TaxID=156978 RepID=A0A239Z838_9CORY|nr:MULTISPECIES: TetR/AcrR family transcriptional regulator [Corynebacterium]MDK8305948.1 TetR/AcrR family transcriptional regulator [Corynebacterium imitans]MDK8636947.1 TetR/AcrR family transcriptional regulator [Corynebacterium imitans]MDK8771975.1 TetR/AcrR family transcriptional regulator [Corynebacterium imitans]SNV66866.1 putative regulatory protein [Corynebacterium imitans]